MSSESKPVASARKNYPVARPVAPKIATADPAAESEKPALVEDLLSPSSIRGWAWSISAHAVLLLILAFWFFTPPVKPEKVFDTRLAGSEFGDPMSDQLKGGLGMDEAELTMPQVADPPPPNEVSTTTITSLPVSEIVPTLSASKPKVNNASNGGGVSLTGPGQAGAGDGFGVAKYGPGGESINGVNVKVGDPQFTLIWDNRVDLDLHVVEPGGNEIWWAEKHSPTGGEQDVDDTNGFGPENINYQEKQGPPGVYRWFVHYYGGNGGISVGTNWKVRVKYNGQVTVYKGKFNTIDQKSRNYELKVGGPAPSKPAASPAPKETTDEGQMSAAPRPNRVTSPEASTTSAPAAKTGPQVVSPLGAGFSVTMPDTPRIGREPVETPFGSTPGLFASLERPEGALSTVSVAVPAVSDPSKSLEEMTLLAVKDLQGTLTRKAQVAQDGSAGREFEMTLPDSVVAGGGFGRGRVFLSNGRFLILTAYGTKSFVDSPEVSAFIQSFKLLSP